MPVRISHSIHALADSAFTTTKSKFQEVSRNFDEHYTINDGAFTMTKVEFQDVLRNFDDHYKISNGAGGFTALPVSKIELAWDVFLDALVKELAASKVSLSAVVLVFTHKYFNDAAGKEWGLAMDCYGANKDIEYSGGPDTYIIQNYQTTALASFELRGNHITLTNTISRSIDANYFSEVFCDELPLDQTDEAGHIRSLVFPLNFELLQLYKDNDLLLTANKDVRLVIASCSVECADFADPAAHSRVQWPHGLAMYFQKNVGGTFTDLLDNTNYVVIFKNKSADYSTLCPPACGVYNKPI